MVGARNQDKRLVRGSIAVGVQLQGVDVFFWVSRQTHGRVQETEAGDRRFSWWAEERVWVVASVKLSHTQRVAQMLSAGTH